jgi:hypothetical protein
MSFVYTPAKAKLLAGDLDFSGTGLQDIRLLAVMTNTTADTDQDVATISAIGTLDEFDGSGYARQALAGETVNQDDPNNRGEFDANDVAFGALGNGTRQIQGFVLYRHITNDADAVPIAFIDNAGSSFALNPGGASVTIQWNVEGIVQAT